MRLRRDIDDMDESLFGREEAIARRLDRAEMIAAGEERARQEAIIDEAARARAVEFTLDTNRLAILAEYRAEKLTPPRGILTSLSLLRSIGWTIREIEGERILVAPPPPVKYEPKGECS